MSKKSIIISGTYQAVARGGVFTIPKKLRTYFESESDEPGHGICWFVELMDDTGGVYLISSQINERMWGADHVKYKEFRRIDSRGRVKIPGKIMEEFDFYGPVLVIGCGDYCLLSKD